MRYLASEKLEIIRLVEQSHLPIRRTLAKHGMAFSARDFTAGTIACRPAVLKHWKINRQDRGASGTAFLAEYASGSFNWL